MSAKRKARGSEATENASAKHEATENANANAKHKARSPRERSDCECERKTQSPRERSDRVVFHKDLFMSRVAASSVL